MKKENQEIINDHFNNKKELTLGQKIILADVIKEEVNIGLVDANDNDSQWRMYVDLLSAFVEAPKAKDKTE
jgi:hypothetical protein